MKKSRLVAFICILILVLNHSLSTIAPAYAAAGDYQQGQEGDENLVDGEGNENGSDEDDEDDNDPDDDEDDEDDNDPDNDEDDEDEDDSEDDEDDEDEDDSEDDEDDEDEDDPDDDEDDEDEDDSEDDEDDDDDDEDDDEPIVIVLSEDNINAIVVNGKVYDGTTEVEFDLSNVRLEGVADEDDVYLVCDAEFADKNAGEGKQIVLSNFSLDGEDAEKYTLDIEEGFTAEKTADITKRTIHISGEGKYTEGENLPKNAGYSYDTAEIVSGDSIDIPAVIIVKDAGGQLAFSFEENAVTELENYVLVLNDDISGLDYESIPTISINSARLSGTDGHGVLQIEDVIYTNGRVNISVGVYLNHECGVTVGLFDGDNSLGSKEVPVSKLTYDSNVKKYKATVSFAVKKTSAEAVQEMQLRYSVATNLVSKTDYLEVKFDDSQEATSTLVFKTSVPVIDKDSVNTHNGYYNKKNYKKGGHFWAELNVSDDLVGIKSIRYRWDNDIAYLDVSEWKQFALTEAQKNPGAVVAFSDDCDWKNGIDRADIGNGHHVLFLAIEDNLGNVLTVNFTTDGIDIEAPEVTEITLDRKNKNVSWEDTVRCDSDTVYVNHPLTLSVKVKDYPESVLASGVGSVQVCDGNNTVFTLKKESEGLYSCVIPVGTEISNFEIRVTDVLTHENLYSIGSLLKGDLCVDFYTEPEQTEEESADPELLFSWKDFLKNCTAWKWVFNDAGPQNTPDYEQGVAAGEGIYYFDEGSFLIEMEDENGLLGCSYVLDYNPSMNGPVESNWTWTKVDQKDYAVDDKSETFEIAVSAKDEKMNSGCYRITFISRDVCQNKTKSVYYFFVDHEEPSGNIAVETPAEPYSVTLDEEMWVSEKDADGNRNAISVKIALETTGADIESVKVVFKGYHSNTAESVFGKDKLRSDENGYFVIAEIPEELDFHVSSHVYDVSVTVYSISGNQGTFDGTIHVDTEDPVVDALSVAALSRAVNKRMNILPFGVYANDAVRLRAEVSDGQLDAGVDRVHIYYIDAEGSKCEADMQIEKRTGLYYFDVYSLNGIMDSDIVITVYDKMGKASENALRIQDFYNEKTHTDDGNTHVVIEANAPKIVVTLPQADYVQDDDSVWYRSHTDSEEDKEAFVEVVISDMDSGIRKIDLKINDQSIDHVIEKEDEVVVTDLERDGAKLFDTDLSEEAGREDREELRKEYHYFYSLETIAGKVSADKDTGCYKIEIIVTDNAGNETNVILDENDLQYLNQEIVFYRDVTAPSIERITLDPGKEKEATVIDKEDFVSEMGYGYYFLNSVAVTVDIIDVFASSQMDYAVFTLIPYEGEEAQEAVVSQHIAIKNGKAAYTIPDGFKGQLKCIAYDKVGNASEEITLNGIVIDNGIPSVSMEALDQKPVGKDVNGTDLFAGAVRFRVTVSDPVSGVKAISYSYGSELGRGESGTFTIPEDAGLSEKDDLGNGWIITGRDHNLVTEVSKVFTFNSDDNDIAFTCQGIDRAENESESIKSDKFTIDTIVPQIYIENKSKLINQMYYNGSTTFTITIVERNFSPEYFDAMIRNTYNGVVPNVKYTTDPANKSLHYATVFFPEGDYSFSFSGNDLCGHRAKISYNGAAEEDFFSTIFRVDASKPKVKTNFAGFGKDDDNGIFFSKEQVAEIVVNEHNFVNGDMGIKVYYLPSGSDHVLDDENWMEIGYQPDWVDDGDTHTLKIHFAKDGIYRITMNPIDRAGNKGVFEQNSSEHTAIFEIDLTTPVLSRKSDLHVAPEEIGVPFYEVYDEKRKDEKPPFVEFADTNIDHIEVEAIIYTPVYENGKELGEIVINPISEELSKDVAGNRFDVTHFDTDGVYAFTLVAVDKAGNRSEAFNCTYFRMVDIDVLAYIYNSKKGDKYSDNKEEWPKGYYSLVNEDGKPISKKATDFDDLDIFIIKPIDDTQAGKIALREDEKLYTPYDYKAFVVEDEIISDTAVLQRIHLPGEYFAETFPDDGLNTRMYLSATIRDDVYLDLASVHIDNEAPVGVLPEEFANWHNYFFVDEQVITITGISEALDNEKTKVYECPRKGERIEIPHTYDAATGTLSFTLTKGVHHIDVSLVDEAGNEWNVPRVKYIRVGNFRLYLAASLALLCIGAFAFLLIRRGRRNRAQYR